MERTLHEGGERVQNGDVLGGCLLCKIGYRAVLHATEITQGLTKSC